MTPIWMTVIGFTIIFVATTAGAATVFFTRKETSGKVNTLTLGFAAGVMVAASVWSLLLPALEEAENLGYGALSFLPAVGGFLIGGAFLVLLDYLVPHQHISGAEEGLRSERMREATKLYLAVTIHNIPEGLAVGFAFGAAATVGTSASYVAAMGLAVGIAIQNFPEGAALALPIHAASGSRLRAFSFGVKSGIPEPIFAVVGYFLSAYIAPVQPWFSAFAAGAMIFVVAEDLIPDAKYASHPHLGTWGIMLGFVVMMSLDVAFG